MTHGALSTVPRSRVDAELGIPRKGTHVAWCGPLFGCEVLEYETLAKLNMGSSKVRVVRSVCRSICRACSRSCFVPWH